MNQRAGDATAGVSAIVVVDSGERRRALVDLLGRLGREIICAESAEDLLSELPEEPRFVLLCATHLPGMSGLELLKTLRDRGIRCPVILISHDSDIPTAVGAIRAGAADFIEHPFIDRVLLRRVRSALETSDGRGTGG
jgi:FixJ family two-component response regulator